MTENQRKKFRLFTKATFGLFAANFAISYHCIFNVEWLGWDIIEPLTYTFTQGMFITGMLAIMKSKMKMKSGEYSGMENYLTTDKLDAIFMKQGNINMIETRHQYLHEQMEKLE